VAGKKKVMRKQRRSKEYELVGKVILIIRSGV
jgi:hypothetical protein